MRAALIALMLTFATQAGADCGKLCGDDWWRTATTADLQAELSGGADVMARDDFGRTPLHNAAQFGTPEVIQALLAAGEDAKAKDEKGKTPWDLAQENEKLKGTKGYWALNDAEYNYRRGLM